MHGQIYSLSTKVVKQRISKAECYCLKFFKFCRGIMATVWNGWHEKNQQSKQILEFNIEMSNKDFEKHKSHFWHVASLSIFNRTKNWFRMCQTRATTCCKSLSGTKTSFQHSPFFGLWEGGKCSKKPRFLLAAKQPTRIEIWRRNKQGTIGETRPKLHLLHKP